MSRNKVTKGQANKLAKVQSKIKRGDYAAVASATGFNRSHVWRVLNGERGLNTDILNAASKMVGRKRS